MAKEMKIKSMLKRVGLFKLFKFVTNVIWLAIGLVRFSITGFTPKSAHLALINLFCMTRGFSNDILHWITRIVQARVSFRADGILGELNKQELDRIGKELEKKGYYIFERRLSHEICDKLVGLALNENLLIKPEKSIQVGPVKVRAKYERGQPKAVRYDFDEADLVKDTHVQSLMADKSVLAVAQQYLQCRPYLDLVACWWHTNFQKSPDKDAAQFFHFDMDRIKWVKFFFYLTDVGPENGPHTFVAKSHRTKAIPSQLLEKGAVRLTDEEVGSHFSTEDIIEFTAPRGTIIAEDTRGLHKGRHVESGDRLVFQLEFSGNLFGMEYPKVRGVKVVADDLKAMIRSFPEIYSQYFAKTDLGEVKT